MCFSPEASFAAGAVLVAVGGHAAHRAATRAPDWVPLAVYPLAFGVQQIIEGGIWVALPEAEQTASRLALGFLLFSHLFWPLWAPLSVWWLRRRSARARPLLALTVAGAALGTALYLPLLRAGAVPVGVADGHLFYDTISVYRGSLAPEVVLVPYGIVVLIPFLMAGLRSVQAFGLVVALSMFGAYAFFEATLISVWCFFAALISAWLVWLVESRVRRRALV